MDSVHLLPSEEIGCKFIPDEFIPPGQDEYYLRNNQVGSSRNWRALHANEVEELVRNGNTCDNWDNFLVTDEFKPSLIRNSEFFGLVRIGRLVPVILQHHDLKIPAGIVRSRVISCDVGDDVAIHDVRYLAHYIIGNRTVLVNIDEMHTTNHSKFGNGIVKDGEPEDVRVWLDLMNETGSRAVMPFDGMIPADAYIWARFREHGGLQEKLGAMTQKRFDSRRGFYGEVGDQSVLKSCRFIKDAKIGPFSYIKGANKLKNITVNSSEAEPTQIGEGVELVNGIVGYGCHIFYGCKAVRFIMGNNSNLKYGARLLHSYLGDNSTVSCCEMLNNLIFPAHEQHHNNSFLVASLLMGQTNLAAGATVGSNHNSRANDGEIQAGRGFWPGLCSTFKHSSKFASFVLAAKGDYPAELNIPLPFTLLSNDTAQDRLVMVPGFWWTHNMYALARNTWKFKTRDKREVKIQNIEFDALAPDTVEEIFAAMELLELWTAKAYFASKGESPDAKQHGEMLLTGRGLLQGAADEVASLEVTAEMVECSKRKVVVKKVREGYEAYRQMILYYAVRNLLEAMHEEPQLRIGELATRMAGARVTRWTNLGGQLVPERDALKLIEDIASGRLCSWDDIHRTYAAWWEIYPQEKQRHAYASLLALLNVESISPELWCKVLEEAAGIQEYVCDQVYKSRKKDYDNAFRQATYRNSDEMRAAIGTPEGNSFVKQVRAETAEFRCTTQKVALREQQPNKSFTGATAS